MPSLPPRDGLRLIPTAMLRSAHFAVRKISRPSIHSMTVLEEGGAAGFGGDGIATTTTETTKVGNVVIDIFDAHTQKLLWRGTDSQNLSSNPNSNIQKLSKDINNLFKYFPPK